MTIKSPKHKGSRFESLIQKKLRELVPEACRTMGSGCSKDEKGDIRNFRLRLIECKHYKKITWGMLIGWWEKIKIEAVQENLQPVLIYKEDRQPIMVMERFWDREHILEFETWIDEVIKREMNETDMFYL